MDSMYCGEDLKYSNHSKLIVIIECTVTFFIPLALTVITDISVLLWRNSCVKQFTLVSNEEIGDGQRKSSHLKIVSSYRIKSTKRKRSIAIRKCLISATITLFLNLPNYSLQLLDEFYVLRDNPNIEIRRMFLRIDAFVYLLYLIQFPVTPIYIFLFCRVPKRRLSSKEQINIMNRKRSSKKKRDSLLGSSFMSYYNAVDNFGSYESKNVFSPLASDKFRRRPSQFDRAVHKAYSEPPQLFENSFVDTLYHRFYWSLRALQFKIFYKNEDMDLDEVVDKWEIGVQPPSLEQLTQTTRFSPRWIKYMYAKFKNESPTGKMREEEFKRLLASIIAPEKATDQYISRLFMAFAGRDKKTITFENLLQSLAHVHPQTAETNAKWTMRLITGGEGDNFGYSAFLEFTQSVFQLNEGKTCGDDANKESVHQRATTIFGELDSDRDGLVTFDDMIRFFQKHNESSLGFTPVSPHPSSSLNGFGGSFLK